jgi:hypothetical protein
VVRQKNLGGKFGIVAGIGSKGRCETYISEAVANFPIDRNEDQILKDDASLESAAGRAAHWSRHSEDRISGTMQVDWLGSARYSKIDVATRIRSQGRCE